MDDVDLGVAVSVTSLVMALAQDNLDQYKGAYTKAAARLKRILVDGDYAGDYLYYKVPCPWIQVKLLRLLQYFPPSGMSCQRSFYMITGADKLRLRDMQMTAMSVA
jgi:AP-2 complex subunit alpha